MQDKIHIKQHYMRKKVIIYSFEVHSFEVTISSYHMYEEIVILMKHFGLNNMNITK